jgi:hypothetical protein
MAELKTPKMPCFGGFVVAAGSQHTALGRRRNGDAQTSKSVVVQCATMQYKFVMCTWVAYKEAPTCIFDIKDTQN